MVYNYQTKYFRRTINFGIFPISVTNFDHLIYSDYLQVSLTFCCTNYFLMVISLAEVFIAHAICFHRNFNESSIMVKISSFFEDFLQSGPIDNQMQPM